MPQPGWVGQKFGIPPLLYLWLGWVGVQSRIPPPLLIIMAWVGGRKAIFEKTFHLSVCTWSLSSGMSGTVDDPMNRAVVLQVNDAGSIPAGNRCIISLGMANVMEKWFFHAQTRTPMLTTGERLKPPEMFARRGGSGWVP